MYIYGFTPDKQIIVKGLIFLSLDQKSFKSFYHVSAKRVSATSPFSVSWEGSNHQSNIHAVNTIVIANHLPSQAIPNARHVCQLPEATHASMSIHARAKGNSPVPPPRPYVQLLACQCQARGCSPNPASGCARARITARRTSASPPRAIRPRRGPPTSAPPRRLSLPPPIHLAYVRSPGRAQHPLEEEVTLLPEA
jgi:hypothetical protein